MTYLDFIPKVTKRNIKDFCEGYEDILNDKKPAFDLSNHISMFEALSVFIFDRDSSVCATAKSEL